MQKPIFLRHLPRQTLGLLGCFLAFPASSQVVGDVAENQLQRQQQREEAQRRQDESTPDVRLQAPSIPKPIGYPTGETPCFVIRQVKLEGEQAETFQWVLAAAEPALGRCLGSTGINTLVAEVQNALVGRGYVTSRVLAAPQDLQGGELHLKLVPGKIRAIRFADAVPRGGYSSALPTRNGDILNLRAIEQGLEKEQMLVTWLLQ